MLLKSIEFQSMNSLSQDFKGNVGPLGMNYKNKHIILSIEGKWATEDMIPVLENVSTQLEKDNIVV